ncbi:dUTP diphosphatase [uncultured Slackia sp.]|uniref:dUTP diphosphatase n=1 Tax=uncultured Slackia sp. TaxID=665903 RepID=UPI0025ED69A8|nr:dUTP diphosphatase [uncultured Slackia sp.]
MSETKIERCPRCDHSAWLENMESIYGGRAWAVECEHCHCSVVVYGTKEEAVDEWNRRARRLAGVAEIETVCAADQMPTRAHMHDAGADLRACEYCSIGSRQFAMVPTGVRVSIPEGYFGLLAARSSLCMRGLLMANGVGIIDAGFTGEIKVPLFNAGCTPSSVLAGERIAQLVVIPCELPTFRMVDGLEDTERGEGGFGSTGVE